MRVLITGIAGHLGSRMAEWIMRNATEPTTIVGIDNLSTGYRENVPDDITVYKYDLGTIAGGKLDALFETHQPDYVFHFAAFPAEGLSPFIREYNYRNNLLATAQIVNACIRHEVKRLVYTSSMAVYGEGDPPFDEADYCNPIDPYGNAKLAAERDIAMAAWQHGLDYCIIRPHNLYGPYQDIWTPYRNVLGIWMARHLRGLPLRVYGSGEQQRAFSFIDDCLPCFWRAATARSASGLTINLGGANPITINDAAALVSEIVGGASIEHVESRREVAQAWCTTQRSINVLAYREETSLREGIDQMWQWAKVAWNRFPERRNRSQCFEIEVERGLYSFWRQDDAASGVGGHYCDTFV